VVEQLMGNAANGTTSIYTRLFKDAFPVMTLDRTYHI
jgi:hypothetical protein